ncbi:MAG: hypothetical protein KGL18_00940 [Burkholderiales bacterium]|nr:hypothetical protein [Burkholderiales bacterium]MDE1925787.1 hypothetical protein [Burkholderiales bacterium]MDE2501528.1 hypothetical protein [Burkholderiales bacterium]
MGAEAPRRSVVPAPTYDAAQLRLSIDALASDTQRLANAGNADAAQIVNALHQRGITISLPEAAAAH